MSKRLKDLTKITSPEETSSFVVVSNNATNLVTVPNLRSTLLAKASPSTLGAVKVGTNLTISESGVLSVVSELPAQSGNNGKYLTTNGNGTLSWGTISVPPSLPSQGGNAGKYLKTNGVVAAWELVPSPEPLPPRSSNAGKYLTTDGTILKWETVGATGNANTGDLLFANNVMSISSGTDIYIETQEDGAQGQSRLVLKPEDDNEGTNPTRLEGSYGVGIWANTTDAANNNEKKWLFDIDGTLTLPTSGKLSNGYPGQTADGSTWVVTGTGGGVASTDGAQYLQIGNGDGVRIGTSWSAGGINAKEWAFGLDGNLTLPQGGDILDSTGSSVLISSDQSLNTTDSVEFTSVRVGSSNTSVTNSVAVLGGATLAVFSAADYQTGYKLIIVVESEIDGDGTFAKHTQVAEATIAATFNTVADPVMSVYGIVYTSPTPLATFTVTRGVSTIEVFATNTQTSKTINVRVHSTKFISIYD